MSDAFSLGSTPSNLEPAASTAFNSKTNIALLAGMALTADTGGGGNVPGSLNKALASASQTARCCGLASRSAAIDTVASCQYTAMLALTEAQWDAVLTDDSGTGLAPGSYYYVSAATAGGLTRTPPVGGNFVTPVGLAINATALLILLQVAVVTSS